MSNSTETYRRRYREDEYVAESEEIIGSKDEKKTTRKHRRSSNFESPEATTEQNVEKYIFVANAEQVNIRERPSMQSRVLKIVKKNDKLKLVSNEKVKGFWIVEYNDDKKQGFIYSDYTKLV